ncbi:MAG: hypothetical protein A2104_00690 [Candidatus Melainabacteria bacterium GWF2_32_7]|nr:MAG: hypothetical protein A2104_00690 [Candidatus Melainabacteria bacterium GWF2_32_7]
MKINTSRFGEIEIDENLIFDFIEPILGYEHLSKYVLIDNMPDSPFKWLQSAEDVNIAFPVTFPGYFGLNYQFVIPEEETKKLGLSGIEDLLSMNIVCIPPGNPQAATINLLGPLVINAVNKKALQLVLINTNHTVKHKLFPGNAQENKEAEKVENKV